MQHRPIVCTKIKIRSSCALMQLFLHSYCTGSPAMDVLTSIDAIRQPTGEVQVFPPRPFPFCWTSVTQIVPAYIADHHGIHMLLESRKSSEYPYKVCATSGCRLVTSSSCMQRCCGANHTGAYREAALFYSLEAGAASKVVCWWTSGACHSWMFEVH
jgi:hypothetical protein